MKWVPNCGVWLLFGLVLVNSSAPGEPPAAFTFLAPFFGVMLFGGVVVLGEPVTALIWIGLSCAAGGVYIVNR